MKKLCFLVLALSLAACGFAQKGKNKSPQQGNSREEARRVILGEPNGNQENQSKKDDDAVWEGTPAGGGPKPSKKQPARVRQAFAADYPHAANVRWSKYRGNWTATFTNGTGQRKDTRTAVARTQLPRTIEAIFRKRPAIRLGNIVRIELPVKEDNLYRVQTIDGGTSLFTVYNARGQVVDYDY